MSRLCWRSWIVLLWLPLAACGRDTSSVLDLTGDPEAGAELFQEACARCHGEDARGGSGPDLASRAGRLDDEAIVEAILNGKGRMKAVDLTDQETADVLSWLRREFGGG